MPKRFGAQRIRHKLLAGANGMSVAFKTLSCHASRITQNVGIYVLVVSLLVGDGCLT